jgi:hypothetical protein
MQVRFHSALILFALALQLAPGAIAQVFKVQGGTSTLLNAQGGSVEFKAPGYDGSIGMGFFDGHFEYGASAERPFHGYTLLAGDEAIPFVLPTDIFDSSHYFSARGAGVMRKDSDSDLYVLGGTTSTWLGTGFFNAAKSDDPVGVLFYERNLTDHLRFFSRDIVSNRQTSLQGLEWKQNKFLKASLAGGIGSNQKYFASAIEAESKTFLIKASYVVMGDMFHRITVASALSSEVDKGNVQMMYKPTQFLTVTTGHQNILEPLTLGGPEQAATINQFSTDFHLAKFYFGTGLFTSDAEGRSSQGTNFYVGRRINDRLEMNANYFRSTSSAYTLQTTEGPTAEPGQTSTILSGTVRERFSSRFGLLQLVSRTDGQTNVGFGGDFTSNRLMARVDYQNVYLPFRPDHPFEQAMAVDASLRVTGPWQVTAASNVAPDGHIRYSFGVSTYLYRLNGMMTNGAADSFSIAKYLVQGVVNDDHGDPVEGAALHIGKQLAYTDSTGHFSVRFSKRGPFLLKVVPDEFINNIVYEVVDPAAQVTAAGEGAGTEIQVVVRTVPPKNLRPISCSAKCSSDTTGFFSARFSQRGPFPLTVVPDEFRNNSVYEVADAPAQVSATSDGGDSEIRIVVRIVPPPKNGCPIPAIINLSAKCSSDECVGCDPVLSLNMTGQP